MESVFKSKINEETIVNDKLYSLIKEMEDLVIFKTTSAKSDIEDID